MSRKCWWTGQPTDANPHGRYSGELIRANESETQCLILCNETGAEVWIPIDRLTWRYTDPDC